MTSDVKYYLTLLLRRAPMILVIAGITTAGAIAYALSLPRSYTSTARIMVEAPQTSAGMSSSTVTTTPMAMMGLIQQKVTARDNLVALAKRHQMLPETTTLPEDEIAALAGRSITLRNSTTTLGELNVVSTVVVNAATAQAAAAIAQDVVDQVLLENTRARTTVAGNTVSFLQAEVDNLAADLEERTQEIVAFQNANSAALPSGLTYRQNRQASLQDQIVQLRSEIESMGDQAENLRQVFKSTGGGTALEQQLVQIQTELSTARLVYSETNPNVRRLLARQAQIEEQIRAQAEAPAPEPANPQQGTGNVTLDLQLVDIEQRRQALEQQIPAIEAELATLTGQIDATPANASVLLGLEKAQDAAQERYNGARARLIQAQSGDRLEQSEQAQRMTVLEAPSVPAWPTKPNRKLIAVGGLAAGLGAGFGLAILLELLGARLRRPADLVRTLNITPIVTIPVLPKMRG